LGWLRYCVEYKDDHELIYDKIVISGVISNTRMPNKRIGRLPNLLSGSRVITIMFLKKLLNEHCITILTAHLACWAYAVTNATDCSWLTHNDVDWLSHSTFASCVFVKLLGSVAMLAQVDWFFNLL